MGPLWVAETDDWSGSGSIASSRGFYAGIYNIYDNEPANRCQTRARRFGSTAPGDARPKGKGSRCPAWPCPGFQTANKRRKWGGGKENDTVNLPRWVMTSGPNPNQLRVAHCPVTPIMRRLSPDVTSRSPRPPCRSTTLTLTGNREWKDQVMQSAFIYTKKYLLTTEQTSVSFSLGDQVVAETLILSIHSQTWNYTLSMKKIINAKYYIAKFIPFSENT